MVSQTVLPFKLDSTDETLTAQAGLALFGEYCHALGLPGWIDAALPAPGSGAGYAASSHVLSVVFMLHAGGRSLEDLRRLRVEAGLLTLLKFESVPSSDSVGDWLRRMGNGPGLAGLADVQRQVLAQALANNDCTAHTLDIDATQIVAEKEAAHWTYKGEQGYMPMVGHLAETGLVVGDEFRECNAAPAARNLEFIRTCQAHGQRFAIGAARDTCVNAAIAAIPEAHWSPWRDGEIAETVHCMNRTEQAFRLIGVRRGHQGALFEENASPYRYTVVASNRQESAAATIAWYGQRGEASENRIKELKIGFGMERMPCGQFEANAVFFRLGVLAYNLFKGFTQTTLDAAWHRHQVQTLRWRVYQTAGKIVRHAGQQMLKINSAAVALFASVRQRCWALAVRGAA